MYKRFIAILVFCLLSTAYCGAQTESDTAIKTWLKARIAVLADTSMHGRGYVQDGREDASAYIRKQFRKYHLKKIKRAYRQTYSFPVNIFPGKMDVAIDGKQLRPGVDFIVDAGSSSFNGDHLNFEKVDLATIKDKEEWRKKLATFRSNNKAYYLENVDSICKLLGLKKHFFLVGAPGWLLYYPSERKVHLDR